MKFVIRTLVGWTMASIGTKTGAWLWNEFLEEKANTLKKRFVKKDGEPE